MAKLLLDKNGNMKFPTIIMSNKALEKLGTIPYDYSSFEYTKYIGYSEGSFVVYKKLIDDTGNEIECRFWDDLVDLSVVYIREFNEYFEVEVSLVESDSVNKTITLTSLHVAELSQINAYVEINTEEDIDRDDYLFPTVFYNPEDPTTSMLNRLLDDKAPHYSIGTVPVTLRNIQRTFSWSGTSIWDAFGDIEEEIGCKFLVQGRIIDVVDMMTTCNDCGYRGDFLAECPKCSGTNVTMPYGDFTNIYVSRENLSEDITLTTEDQNMKNCFRLEAGDEDMTAAVVNLNPSGSRYIYHFSDKMKERISSDLRTALNSFESAYESYRTRSYSFDSALSSAYDALVTKYNDSEYSAYYYNDDNERVLQVNNFKNSQNIDSYEDLISLYYDASGFYNYLNSTLMPSAEVDITTAQGQLDAILHKITEVGINNYDATRTSNETVASSIKMLCGAVLTGGFRINVTCEKTETEGVYDTEITVTNYSDDTDTATDSTLITISDDYELFFVQKMAKLMRDNLDNSVYNIIDFDVDDNEQDFIDYLKHYDYNDLDSFSNAYSEAIDLFVQENNAELNDMETLYRRKYALINTEMALRESEVDTANDLLTAIEAIISNVKSALDLNTNFLTTKALQDEFNSYRREDSYDNSNFISDGLSDAELIARAIEFYDLATQEVENATRTVYNINATLHNLLLMPEFKDLWEAFEVCNWIAFRVDDKIFRLRILSYNIRYDENDITTIDVDFTTATEGKTASLFGSTQQILQSAKSMATSFPYIKYQTNVNKISVQDVNALTALLNAQLTNKNSEISSLTSSNIDLNGRLIANEIKADRIEANYVSTDTLEATEASINTLIASKASISDLNAATGRIGTLETNYLTVTDTLEAHEGRFDDIEADTAKIHNLTANQISAATGYIADLTSENITAQDLVAMNGTIENLDTNYAHITNGVIDNATISHADVDDLDANYAHITNGVIDNANIDVADVNNLNANYAHITNGVIDNANIDYADVNNLNAHYAEIDLANVNNAWIQDGVIKNAAISDAQIIGVSANKLTAGTIDASNITVTNLNASNITTGTINGQRIGAGSLSLDKLADDVYTESEVDALISGIQAQVDGAIETWTGSVVPTLNNAPASSWTDNDTKANHVGDIYYVVNAGNQADGYCYRFAYDSTTSTYGWVLIKDSDVTAALQRLLEAEGDIDDLETFQSTTSSWISNTDEELTSIKSNHTTLETTVNATIKSTTQLWFTKANTTAPNKPTAHVTSTSTNGNVWTKVVPEYNSSYPNYFYCYEWEYANGTYGWSDVVRDIGMGEVQSTARTASSNASTALTNAATAQSTANANIKSSVQLWYSKANDTYPDAPTSVVTSTLTSGGAWTTVVPTYNASYPYYFYCYQYEASDGTITWSDVVYDRATSESEERARTAITNASTAQTTADSNIKSVVQLWFTKANATAPSQPTAHVTTNSHSSYNTWNTVVPTYNEIYPYYYYCYEYQKGDGTYSWSDVVYDSATSENQKNSRDALSQVSTKVETSVFNTLSQTVEENSNSITSLSTTVEGKADSSTVTTLSNTVNTVSQTTNSNSSTLSNLTTRLGTNADGTASSTDIVAKESALEQDLNGFKSTVSSTYQTIDNMSNYSTTEQMNSAISQSASNITTTVSQTYATQASLNSEINQRKATYGTSSTDAGTATKAVTCENFSLYTGATVRVKFSKANTNATPSLNVNNTGAKAIKNFAGANLVEGEYSWKANATLDFVYDGTNWLLVDNGMTARVSSAESSISQNADNIELKVSKDGVISSINQSPESVTINANRVNIAGATIFTEGRLSETSLNNAYDAKGSASTAETNAKNYTDSIEIGGRNLYVDKDAVDGYLPSTGTNIIGMNSTNREQTSAFISVNVGEHYILQCWIPSIPSSSQAWLAYSFYTAQDLSTRVGSRTAKYGSDGVGYLAYNDIVIPDTVNYIRVSYRRFADGYIKLEKGTKPTDWSPAPEDVDASIDSAISTYDTNTVQATYATKANAIAQEQRVYYKSASSSKPASPTSSWVTKTDAGANTWTTYRMPYDQSYPYLYTCIQKQTVSGTITCTTVLLDDTTTVIDGGKIITGSVTANQLSADAIKSNNYVASSTSGSPYSSGGTFLDLSNGNIYTPNFGVQAASGTAYLNGEIIATSGTIGDDSGNYWSIGNTTDYEGDTSASIVANGTAYIQNGDWQISNGESNYSNGSINTQRYATVSGGGLQLTYPFYDNTYYDFGVTSPVLDTASSRYYNSTVSNNFLYIRKHASTIPSLASDWNYVFRVDKDGNAYVNNLYVNGTSIATMISDGVDGGAYLSTSGGTVNGDVTITGSLTATASRATADGSGNTITTTYMKLAGTQTNSGTNTFSGSNTFSGTTTISKANGLVYSGIQASSTNASTYVWFSKSGTNGTPVYDNDFKYNPSTNVLTVGSITGTAAKATADGSGNTITTTYATKANTAMTGNATAENLTVSGTLTATLTGDVTGNVSGSAGSLTTNAGSATQPIYFSDGVPVATTYALNKTVPSNAVFTDTNWYHSTGTWSGLKYTAGKSNNSMSALEFTIPTGTTATTVALGNHTHNYASKVTLAGTDYSSSSNAITITKANLQSAIQDTDLVLMTAAERSKLSSIQVSSGGTIDFSGVTASTPLTATVNSTNGTVNITHDDSGATAGTYRSVTVDAKGHVTGGTNPTTISGYGITDAKIASGVITLGSNTITPLTASSTLDATKLSGTASISTTGNAGTATALASAGTVRVNLASTSAVTYTSGGNITPGVNGTLGVGNGGTGQTSAVNAANAFLNALSTGSTTPQDADYYISQYVGGGTTTTTYHRRPMSALWAYVKSKMGSDHSNLDSYYVKLTDAQTVAGAKTFSDVATFKGNMIIEGATSNSNAYDATNPKITFSNGSAQKIQLIFSDYDSIVAPSSLTLVGNQGTMNGGERFIAPNVRITNRFEYGTDAYTTYNSATKSIDFIFN